MLLPTVAALAGERGQCTDGGQLALNECARDAAARADRDMGRVYRALVRAESDDPLFISKLKKAQRAWVAFRDAELAARFACEEADPKMCWGSMYPMSCFSAKAELTKERTKHLRRMLKEGQGS